MNYRHFYHAGNFADVFKHVILISLVLEFQKKNKPFFYLDTHAGIAHYDLSLASGKTQEFKNGIGKLWSTLKTPNLPHDLARYLKIIQEYNHAEGAQDLKYYLGSPGLVRHLLRPEDRMILTELHPEDVNGLKNVFYRDPAVAVHYLDGFQALKAFLPPKEGRGLVFLDPPFEQKDEFKNLGIQLKFAADRWPTGTFAVWFPTKERDKVNNFYRQIKSSGLREIIYCEISLPFLTTNLKSCGLLVIHPPWKWPEKIQNTLMTLTQLLSASKTGTLASLSRVGWLVPE